MAEGSNGGCRDIRAKSPMSATTEEQVFTSDKESPEVSAEVIRRGKEFLQSAKPQLKGQRHEASRSKGATRMARTETNIIDLNKFCSTDEREGLPLDLPFSKGK